MSTFREAVHRNGNGVHPRIPEPRFAIAPSASDRLPPQDIDAELACLGSMMLDNKVIPTIVEALEETDFYRQSHQYIFRAIKALHQAGAIVDAVTVADELQRQGTWHYAGEDETLTDCVEKTPSHGLNGPAYAAIVREKALKREQIEVAARLMDEAYSGRGTVAEVLEAATDQLAAIERRVEAPDEDESFFGLAPPSPMHADAFIGPAGELIDLIDPLTEACREAVLGQFLVAFGNLIGKRAHWTIGTDRHWCNLYLCIVGASGMGRKGTSWGVVQWIVEQLDPEWARNRIMSGQSTGAGLIMKIRDPEYDEEGREVEKGVSDKRVLFVESEFGGALTLMSKDGNDLSAVVRDAFDKTRLMQCPKFQPVRATMPHVSIIGHITQDELHLRLGQNNKHNGYANRFLWLHSYRSKLLPRGGRFSPHLFGGVLQDLEAARHFATVLVDPERDFEFDAQAGEWWDNELYAQLTSVRPGDHGHATKRGVQIVRRLAVIYAILGRTYRVSTEHLKAALAFWDYCDRTAASVFRGRKIDQDAGTILDLLRAHPDGLARTAINREVFSGRKKPDELSTLLRSLLEGGLATFEKVETKGRPAVIWKAL